ncbi:hypothetical protein [Brevundimonas sp.]|uniref:hypothetical protein n=1 Tax=Brevundimonas sp. TaxID=1871086 RepID=UPI0035B1CD49
MSTEPETYPTTYEEAQAVVTQIAAAERQKNLYELDVLTEADEALADLATSVRETLEPIAARLLTGADIARLNGAIFAIEQAAQQSSSRKMQLSMLLNPPMPIMPTLPPVAP